MSSEEIPLSDLLPIDNHRPFKMRTRHNEEPIVGQSWQAVEKPEEKTEEERIRELLINNTNMPFPEAVKTVNDLKKEGIDLSTVKIKTFDDKGKHPLRPSNQKKYWKNIRKSRRKGLL